MIVFIPSVTLATGFTVGLKPIPGSKAAQKKSSDGKNKKTKLIGPSKAEFDIDKNVVTLVNFSNSKNKSYYNKLSVRHSFENILKKCPQFKKKHKNCSIAMDVGIKTYIDIWGERSGDPRKMDAYIESIKVGDFFSKIGNLPKAREIWNLSLKYYSRQPCSHNYKAAFARMSEGSIKIEPALESSRMPAQACMGTPQPHFGNRIAAKNTPKAKLRLPAKANKIAANAGSQPRKIAYNKKSRIIALD